MSRLPASSHCLVSVDARTTQDFDEVLRVNLKGVFLVGATDFIETCSSAILPC